MLRSRHAAAQTPVDWHSLPESLQLALAQRSLVEATSLVAGHAEQLAAEMERGALEDHGGPDALRLLAAIMRSTTLDWRSGHLANQC